MPALVASGHSPVQPGLRMTRVQGNGLVQVLDGPGIILQHRFRNSAIPVGPGILRIEGDGPVKIRDGFGPVAQETLGNPPGQTGTDGGRGFCIGFWVGSFFSPVRPGTKLPCRQRRPDPGPCSSGPAATGQGIAGRATGYTAQGADRWLPRWTSCPWKGIFGSGRRIPGRFPDWGSRYSCRRAHWNRTRARTRLLRH